MKKSIAVISSNIVLGLGVTLCKSSARLPASVISHEGRLASVQFDKVQQLKSEDGSELGYRFVRNHSGNIVHFKFRAGKWIEVVRNPKTGRLNRVWAGYAPIFGMRDKFEASYLPQNVAAGIQTQAA